MPHGSDTPRPISRGVNLREVAAEANVSVMTASRALRNHPNVSEETKARVQQVAKRLGYRPNPLISALMSSRPTGRPVKASLTIGYLTAFPRRDEWHGISIFQEFHKGAMQAADRLGYHLDEFWLAEPGMSEARMSQQLFHRNIAGVIVAPFPQAGRKLALDWTNFAAVAIGYSLAAPVLHRVVNHQFRSMRRIILELRQRGYRRLGLALPSSSNERVDHQWLGCFLAEQLDVPAKDRVPPLIVDDHQWTQERLATWYHAHRPDVIINQQPETVDWLKAAGLRVPEDVGFAHLNCEDVSGKFAGIRQNGHVIGEVAVNQLISMLQRNERGVPGLPLATLVDGTWIDGRTVRNLKTA